MRLFSDPGKPSWIEACTPRVLRDAVRDSSLDTRKCQTVSGWDRAVSELPDEDQSPSTPAPGFSDSILPYMSPTAEVFGSLGVGGGRGLEFSFPSSPPPSSSLLSFLSVFPLSSSLFSVVVVGSPEAVGPSMTRLTLGTADRTPEHARTLLCNILAGFLAFARLQERRAVSLDRTQQCMQVVVELNQVAPPCRVGISWGPLFEKAMFFDGCFDPSRMPTLGPDEEQEGLESAVQSAVLSKTITMRGLLQAEKGVT